MKLPNIEDLISCGNQEYLKDLTRRLLQSGFGPLTSGHPQEDTRQEACKEPKQAFLYARGIDRGPREDTRTSSCGDAYSAYQYALLVDQGPREDTRQAACGDPYWAYYYALRIDKGFHEETWATVQGTSQESLYRTKINKEID